MATRSGSKSQTSTSRRATSSTTKSAGRRRVQRKRTSAAADQAPRATATASVPADDAVLAASNAQQALSPDMRRVAWLRSQLHQMETHQRERLVKVAELTAITIIFITFVLQNAQPVNVHFLLFSINIRLIWVIFGCGFLGGTAGYLIGRPDKSLRALLPQKAKKPARTRA